MRRGRAEFLRRVFALGGQWGSSGLRKDALLGRRDEGGLGSPHARVYGKWPPADARRVAPGTGRSRPRARTPPRGGGCGSRLSRKRGESWIRRAAVQHVRRFAPNYGPTIPARCLFPCCVSRTRGPSRHGITTTQKEVGAASSSRVLRLWTRRNSRTQRQGVWLAPLRGMAHACTQAPKPSHYSTLPSRAYVPSHSLESLSVGQ